MNRSLHFSLQRIERPLYLLAAFVIIGVIWAYHTPIDITVSAMGIVRPRGEVVRVVPEVGGRVRKVNLRDGVEVKAGDVLIQLETRETDLKIRSLESQIHAVEQAISNLEERIGETAFIDGQTASIELADADAAGKVAGSNLKQARFRFERATELFSAGLISRQALDDLHTSLMQAEAEAFRHTVRAPDLTEAKVRARIRELESGIVPLKSDLGRLYSQLEQAWIEQERFTITSPCDGELTLITPIHVSEVLVPGKPIALIVPITYAMVVEAWLPTTDRRFVSVGQGVRLQTDSFPQDEYDRIQGRVDYISPDAIFDDVRPGLYRVVISLTTSNPTGLQLGMPFRAHFVSRQEPLLWLFFQRVRKQFQN